MPLPVTVLLERHEAGWTATVGEVSTATRRDRERAASRALQRAQAVLGEDLAVTVRMLGEPT